MSSGAGVSAFTGAVMGTASSMVGGSQALHGISSFSTPSLPARRSIHKKGRSLPLACQAQDDSHERSRPKTGMRRQRPATGIWCSANGKDAGLRFAGSAKPADRADSHQPQPLCSDSESERSDSCPGPPPGETGGWLKPAPKPADGWVLPAQSDNFQSSTHRSEGVASSSGRDADEQPVNGHGFLRGTGYLNGHGGKTNGPAVNGKGHINGHQTLPSEVSWDILVDPLNSGPVQEVDIVNRKKYPLRSAHWVKELEDQRQAKPPPAEASRNLWSSGMPFRAADADLTHIEGILPRSEAPDTYLRDPATPDYGKGLGRRRNAKSRHLIAAGEFIGSGIGRVEVPEEEQKRRGRRKLLQSSQPRKLAKGTGGVVMQLGCQVVRVRQDGTRQVEVLDSEALATMVAQAAVNTADLAAGRAVPWNERKGQVRREARQKQARQAAEQRRLEREAPEESSRVGASENYAIGQFLSQIAHYDRLTAEEEVECSRRIKAQNVVLASRTALVEQLGAEPTDEVWARAVGLDGISPLLRVLADGYSAKQRMVEGNLRLVVAVAKEFKGRGLPFLDCCQAGVKGLNTAVERYDAARGTKFSTYAVHWIRQTVGWATKQYGRTVRLPSSAWQALSLITRVNKEVQSVKGRAATEAELAAGTGLSPARVRAVLLSLRPIFSLEGSTEVARVVGDSATVEAWVANLKDHTAQDPLQELAQERTDADVKRLLSFLEDSEAKILKLRYGLIGEGEHSPFQVARFLKKSVIWVRETEGQAFEKLRGPLREYLEDLLPLPV